MGKIKRLDISTINKIAAGEVIERPFSVVKELVENAIDAESVKITVEIKEGGVAFIRVSDNGCGIPAGEIEEAFLNHATSKLDSISDLNSLSTLGFRGEALASIAAVSQLEITSRALGQPIGVHLEIFGGEIIGRREAACNDGTIVVTRNLFYNTPARRKFLKSISAETGYISDFMNKAALSRPDISFRFISNGSELLYTSGSADLKTAIYSVYGREYTEKLIQVDFERDGIAICGFIAKPEYARSNRSMEDIFVNGRFVKDRIISKAAEDAYKTYLTVNRFPCFVLNVETEPESVDVNAHPQKLEVRFADEERIYEMVYDAVAEALKSGSLIRKAEWGVGSSAAGPQKSNDADIKYPDVVLRQSYTAKGVERFVLDALPDTPKPLAESFEPPKAERHEQVSVIESEKPFSKYKILGQVFSTYWIIEENNKLFIIDQHAAHERVLFEKAKSRLISCEIVTQALLLPERLTLTEREKGILMENLDYFKALGFEIERLEQENELYLRGLPMLISAPENTETLRQLLDMMEDGFPRDNDIYDVKVNTLAKIACKAAVKANDTLSFEEARAVIRSLLALENPFTCPHGRPTIVELSKYDLELIFKRA